MAVQQHIHLTKCSAHAGTILQELILACREHLLFSGQLFSGGGGDHLKTSAHMVFNGIMLP